MTRGAYDYADSAWGKSLTDEIREILEDTKPVPLQDSIVREEILDIALEEVDRHLRRRFGTPPYGLLTSTTINEPAERVTRQQRRHQERQARKRR